MSDFECPMFHHGPWCDARCRKAYPLHAGASDCTHGPATHPAPARGVSEAMVERAARYLCGRRNDLMQMYDSDHPLHWHETAIAILTAALGSATPDAEGGA